MDELYVQVPHRIQDYLMTAKLNMTQFRIFNAVVRYTHGYQEEWRQLSFSFLSEKTKCNERQVKRELKVMLEQGVLIERTYNGKRELRVNPLLRGDSSDTSTSDSLDTGRGDSLDTHIKKDIKEIYKENIYFSFPTEEHVFLEIYNSIYKRKFNRDHPKITADQLNRIMDNILEIESNDIDEEQFEEAAENHFDNLPESNDGKIFAFLHGWRRHFEI